MAPCIPSQVNVKRCSEPRDELGASRPIRLNKTKADKIPIELRLMRAYEK